ncbi:hypothetical protein BDQ17DRAFT_1240835 [Cyathus striatus]|nr:hypothetical protein BDQ17DRAFT_1240835 [Cyathus striatus]
MVFAHLQEHEKDAFFSLLDEYFSSRKDIFANVGSSGSSSASSGGAATVSAARAAFHANPEAAAKIASAGLRQFGGQKSTPPAATVSTATFISDLESTFGLLAAASRAFSAINTPSSSASPPVAPKPASASLTSKFGDVDTSSLKNVYGSLRNANANKNATVPPPEVPAALPRTTRSFAPPPHRAPSNVHTPDPPAASSTPPPAPAPPPPPPPPPVARREEPQGEWAEVLYDYESEEPGDLNIKENQRILVTERTSDDWWTGELDDKKGLFPASYVQLL